MLPSVLAVNVGTVPAYLTASVPEPVLSRLVLEYGSRQVAWMILLTSSTSPSPTSTCT